MSLQGRHYSLGMLLNVRLGPEEERVVKGLRRAKVNVSALVRKAIRDSAPKAGRKKSLGEVFDGILEEIPVDEAAPSRRPPLDDRHAMSKYIENRLRRGRK